MLRLEYKGESDWSAKLRDVMPGMLACLRSVSGKGLGVSKAWTMSGGKVGVRIRNQDGNGFDCVALADGSKFESLSGLPSFAECPAGRGQSVLRARAGLAEDGGMPALRAGARRRRRDAGLARVRHRRGAAAAAPAAKTC